MSKRAKHFLYHCSILQMYSLFVVLVEGADL